MLTKRLLISALLAAGTIGAAATPVASAAATHFEFSFGTPVRHEYGYAHRHGHGHWERERGYRRWHRDYGYRDYRYGGYARHTPRWDRDGDGVPNRYDARPNNPYRY